MGTHIPIGPIPNTSATTNSHHQSLGGINGRPDPEYGSHITGQQGDYSTTIWIISHLEDHLEN